MAPSLMAEQPLVGTSDPGLRRRSVVIDKYSEPIFVIAHAHFFRAFPIGRVHGSAVHDDVVIRRVGVINAFQRGGTLNVGQLDFAHGIGSRVTKGVREREYPGGASAIALLLLGARLGKRMRSTPPTQSAPAQDNRKGRPVDFPALSAALEAPQPTGGGFPIAGGHDDHLLGDGEGSPNGGGALGVGRCGQEKHGQDGAKFARHNDREELTN